MPRWLQNALLFAAAWALAVTAYIRQAEMEAAERYAMKAYFVCSERAADQGKDPKLCLEKVEDDWNEWMDRKWRDIAVSALVPIGIGWAGGLVGLYVWRRKRGKNSTDGDGKDTR